GGRKEEGRMNQRIVTLGTTLVASAAAAVTAVAAVADDPQATPTRVHAVSHVAVKADHAMRYQPNRFSHRAPLQDGVVWGGDSLAVKWVESGEVIRFTYRVVDASRAQALNDKRNEPSLIDPRAGVQLVVPTLEKVGALRQSQPPEDGKAYWMAFSNKGRLVKR